MSLYTDAATVLCGARTGSLKSLIYGNEGLRSKPGQVYALIVETAKYDHFISDIVSSSGLLQKEPKLTPLIALLLVHDQLFSKNGIAAHSKHPLRLAVERHKARLQSEFTRARLKRGCGSIEALKGLLLKEKVPTKRTKPRWVRNNLLKTSSSALCLAANKTAILADSIDGLLQQGSEILGYAPDVNIPQVWAINPSFSIVGTNAYKETHIILQDKASCFPAYLLLGNATSEVVGDVIDACAAPGNKTTHLASIMHQQGADGTIFACERDPVRSETLRNQVERAGATNVNVLAKQDFLALDVDDTRFANVTHLLLDPSCSGSGILGREDVPKLVLPPDSRKRRSQNNVRVASNNEQDKANEGTDELDVGTQLTTDSLDPNEEAQPIPTTAMRLEKLSNLQTRIIEHAMAFPAATKITYSTCSIHAIENEEVAAKVLRSIVGQSRGWKILLRENQPDGLEKWSHRGKVFDVRSAIEGSDHLALDTDELEACIRCYPDDNEGTMGFFVCGFVRQQEVTAAYSRANDAETPWEGFD